MPQVKRYAAFASTALALTLANVADAASYRDTISACSSNGTDPMIIGGALSALGWEQTEHAQLSQRHYQANALRLLGEAYVAFDLPLAAVEFYWANNLQISSFPLPPNQPSDMGTQLHFFTVPHTDDLILLSTTNIGRRADASCNLTFTTDMVDEDAPFLELPGANAGFAYAEPTVRSSVGNYAVTTSTIIYDQEKLSVLLDLDLPFLGSTVTLVEGSTT